MPADGSDGRISLSQYIAGFEPGIRTLLREAHKVVTSVAPKADARSYRGWGTRVKTDRGHVGIVGLKGHVKVEVGKRNAVRVRTVADARDPALRDLIAEELTQGERLLKISDSERDRRAARVRRICLALPDVNERLSHGSPTFFYRDKKQLLQILDDFHEDGRFAVWCAAPTGAQAALVKADPDRFFVPPYVGVRGWLGVRLDRDVDWSELEGIVRDAYNEVVVTARWP